MAASSDPAGPDFLPAEAAGRKRTDGRDVLA